MSRFRDTPLTRPTRTRLDRVGHPGRAGQPNTPNNRYRTFSNTRNNEMERSVTTTVNRADLAATLTWVARALPTRPSTPALAGIRLNATDSELTASAFDYEQSTAGTVPVTGKDFDVLVSGRLLVDVIKALPDQTVTLIPTDAALTIKTAKSSFAIPRMRLEDYPALPAVPPELGTLPGPVFADAVHRVAVAAGNDSAILALTTVSMTVRPADQTITLASTDRYRLAIETLPYTPNTDADKEPVTFLVPAKTLETYARALDMTDTVTLHAETGLFGLSTDTRAATTRLLDEQFPEYERILPTEFPAGTVAFPKQEFVAAVKRVSLMTDRPGQPLMFTFADNTVTIAFTADTGSSQAATETIECDYTANEPFTIAFVPGYLLDGVNAIAGQTITMHLAQPTRPVLIEDDDYRYILMPTRRT